MKYLSFIFIFACFFKAPLISITQEELQGYAIKQNDRELIEVLFKYRTEDSLGSSSLNLAMKAKDYFAVFLLIEYGVDTNSRLRNTDSSVLEMAIEYDEISLVEYLLQHKADPTNPRKYEEVVSLSPNRSSNYVSTAVYDAIKLDRLDVLILFAQYGVDLNKPCHERTSSFLLNYKKTPLKMAIEYNNKDIAAFLVSIGAKL